MKISALLFVVFSSVLGVMTTPSNSADAPTSAASGSIVAQDGPLQVITDISHWQHPVKRVFARYGVALRKVTIKGHHPTFEVSFPFDPQTSPNSQTLNALCDDILKANGGWPYSLQSPDDRVEIDVSWDRKSGKIYIDNRDYDSK